MPGTVSYTAKEPVWALAGSAMDSLTLYGLLGEGDITVTITPEYVDEMAHQTGAYVLDKFFNGATVVAEFELKEVLNWAMWPEVFPNGERQIDTSTPPNDRFAFNSSTSTDPYVGTRATSQAQYFVFRPVRQYADAATEKSRDLVIPKGFNAGPVALTYSSETSQVFPFEVHGLFDPDASDGENLLYQGLTTGTWAAV
ncbi:MAG: hypothetical protein GY906_18100 [bacterium]|nr:hypothetical protein [bacterium]